MDDDIRFGRMIRAVRQKRGLTQAELAGLAGLSRQTVSRLELGYVEAYTIATVRLVGTALRMPSPVALGWRGAEVARLLDERHAGVVEEVVAMLRGLGWQVHPEWTFSHFGERGSVDVLAWREDLRLILIVEVKTRIVDMQDLYSSLHRKQRLVPQLLAAEVGWTPTHVGVVLVLPESTTNRSAVARHSASFDAVLPARGIAVRHWLRGEAPDRDIAGIMFLPNSASAGKGRS